MSPLQQSMLDSVFEFEGGFSNDPNDHGGATNWGITHAEISRFLGHDASIDEVKAFPKADAETIYLRNYLAAPRIDQLPEALQPVMFDWGVNAGPGRPIKTLQGLLGLSQDGAIGPATIHASAAACSTPAAATALVVRLCDARVAFYNRLVANDATQGKFLKGWLRRANAFRPKTVEA